MEYNFPFRFLLPWTDLPTSFEQCGAYIGYSVKAIIDIPWSLDLKTTRFFTVINPLDLNLLPELRQPYYVKDIKTCGIIFKKDPIMIEFDTNKSIFYHSYLYNTLFLLIFKLIESWLCSGRDDHIQCVYR